MTYRMVSLKSALGKTSAAVILAVVSGGCGSRLDVLHETPGAGDTGSGGFAPTSGGTGAIASGGANGGGTSTAGTTAGDQAVSICGPGAGDSPGDLVALTMGQACTNSDFCEPGSCAGTAVSPDTGVNAFVTCRNHQVQIVTMTLLDADPNDAWTKLDDGVEWTDCESALSNGRTGESCTWQSQSCIRKTSDTCCLEGAECLAPNGLLRRVRVCAPGCESAAPDTAAPVVTDCASAASVDRCHATAACEGDFICYGNLAESTIGSYDETSQLNGAMWCAGGSLVGGVGLTWGL